MNEAPSRALYGLILSLVTSVMWGVLPIFLTLSLQKMDAITITWYRFAVAAVVVLIMLGVQKQLPKLRQHTKQINIMLAVACVGLLANYVGYLVGLDLLNPESAQVLIQLAPFLLMFGGVVIFKEAFTGYQKAGAVILFAGLLLFFNNKLEVLLGTFGQYTLGVLVMIFAAVNWAIYALAQKKLLHNLTPKQMTFYVYTFGMLALLPFAELKTVGQMNQLQFFALVFCCLNTLIAYGAFTEALHVWQASKVSAVIATAPIFTFISVFFAVKIWPDYFALSDLNVLAYVGAMLVVLGSVVTALGKRNTIVEP